MAFRRDDSDYDFSTHSAARIGESMASYEVYEPAYRLGCELALSSAHRSQNWLSLERFAQHAWKELYPDRPWSEVKHAVRFAWQWVAQMLATPI